MIADSEVLIYVELVHGSSVTYSGYDGWANLAAALEARLETVIGEQLPADWVTKLNNVFELDQLREWLYTVKAHYSIDDRDFFVFMRDAEDHARYDYPDEPGTSPAADYDYLTTEATVEDVAHGLAVLYTADLGGDTNEWRLLPAVRRPDHTLEWYSTEDAATNAAGVDDVVRWIVSYRPDPNTEWRRLNVVDDELRARDTIRALVQYKTGQSNVIANNL